MLSVIIPTRFPNSIISLLQILQIKLINLVKMVKAAKLNPHDRDYVVLITEKVGTKRLSVKNEKNTIKAYS